jgi:hypothetical protein
LKFGDRKSVAFLMNIFVGILSSSSSFCAWFSKFEGKGKEVCR